MEVDQCQVSFQIDLVLQTRIARGGLCLTIIMSGLALRKYGFGVGLPAFIVKYGGSALWGTMLFLLLGMAAPLLGRKSLALIALAVAVAVELFRLVHTPWLDGSRLTLAGALLLGRIFFAGGHRSLWRRNLAWHGAR
jgi:uncharacterized protein DUF2809